MSPVERERGHVSFVVAAFDEVVAIGQVVRGALSAVPGAEVVVVDDGSTDATGEIARAAGARVVTLTPNRGKGHAVRAGLAAARGDVVVLIDGDGQDDPAETPKLLDALVPGVDLVVGSRFLGHFAPRSITPLNRAGNRFLTGAVNALYRARLTDTQAGFKALRRELALALPLSAGRFDIEVDVLLGVLGRGGRVVEVPVHRGARRHGSSRLASFRDGARILARIVRKRLGT